MQLLYLRRYRVLQGARRGCRLRLLRLTLHCLPCLLCCCQLGRRRRSPCLSARSSCPLLLKARLQLPLPLQALLQEAHLLLCLGQALLQRQQLASAGALPTLLGQGGLRSSKLTLALSHRTARHPQLLCRTAGSLCSSGNVGVCLAASLLQQAGVCLGKGGGLVLGGLLALQGCKARGVCGHTALLQVQGRQCQRLGICGGYAGSRHAGTHTARQQRCCGTHQDAQAALHIRQRLARAAQLLCGRRHLVVPAACGAERRVG